MKTRNKRNRKNQTLKKKGGINVFGNKYKYTKIINEKIKRCKENIKNEKMNLDNSVDCILSKINYESFNNETINKKINNLSKTLEDLFNDILQKFNKKINLQTTKTKRIFFIGKKRIQCNEIINFKCSDDEKNNLDILKNIICKLKFEVDNFLKIKNVENYQEYYIEVTKTLQSIPENFGKIETFIRKNDINYISKKRRIVNSSKIDSLSLQSYNSKTNSYNK